VSWSLLIPLAAAAYGFKVVGFVVLGRHPLHGPVEWMVELIPAALLSALVAVQTFGDGRSLTLDARAVGLAVTGVAVWRRLPFFVVIVLAAAATAITRAIAN